MNKFNVLILNSSVIYGGGEFFTFQLSSELIKRGHNILTGCRDSSLLYKKCNNSGLKTIHINFPDKGTSGLCENVKRIRQLIKVNNIQIVHTNTNYDRTAGAFAARKTSAKHITSCHSLEPISHNLTHYIRNKFLTHHFICDGESIRELIIKQNNIPENKITVVHNGVDPLEMKKDDNLRLSTRSELGIKDNEILLGNVGRLVKFKGHKYLLSAFKIISESLTGAKLMVVGDGELIDELREYSKVLGLEDKVIFTGFRDDLNALYSAIDIYIQPSLSEGGELFPFSVLQAMAQGIPVIASKTGDIPLMVKDGENGFLADEKSPFQISQKTIQLINDPVLRQKMGEKGISMVNINFTAKKMADKIEKIYEIMI